MVTYSRTSIFLQVYLNLLILTRIFSLHDVRATCRTVPGLTKDQLSLCYRASDVTAVAIDGLELAVKECQNQFQWHRWNCSSLSTKSRNPHSSNLLKRGYRESAFISAITAAGVVHSVSRACSQGNLISCGCDPAVNRKLLTKAWRESLLRENRLVVDQIDNHISDDTFQHKPMPIKKRASRWKWGGCSHNIDFGVEFSKLFLDTREKAGDIQSQINLHNNQAGRLAVINNEIVRCKCHGMSGSCQLKTCWKSAPEFKVVGKLLKQQFRRAILVDQSNVGNGPPVVVVKKIRKARKNQKKNEKVGRSFSQLERNKRLEASLFYYQRSPNFCDRDQGSDIPGTIGRRCNRTSDGNDGCASMCCGRGYNLIRERRIEKCHCKFNWCCYVECQECEIEEWISICK